MSRHQLSDCKKRCLRCRGSASLATMKEWHATKCHSLVNVNGLIYSPPVGGRIHVGGGWLHHSHHLNFHPSLNVWFCGKCGAIADKQL
eukprot:6564014-Pyramimonas_sp.AAC.1